ncbi:MAG: hypothetical protein ACM3KE_13865 [Hyphomicrobiales bacterium]
METSTVHRTRTSVILRIGCFGHFQSEDRICRSHCAIRIRCAIERDQKIYLEVCEEMEVGEDQLPRFQ